MAENSDDSSGGYSPLLAQMLRIDPEKMGSISLSALGRQALGADSPEYQKAKSEVDAARETMSQALSARRAGPDPSMLALAQGFLAPTRTGSFGESLGAALGGYSSAQAAEEKRNMDMVRMKYDLARAGLADEQTAAQLGLSVASKLAPPLTAFQKQAMSEGLDIRTPAGVARVKELQGTSTATPEMKEFAARTGVSLTDPTFSSKFDTYAKTKSLQDVATRLNLDLTKPEDLAKAQAEAQRDNFRKENPEVAKLLATFGGDALNPADLRRAQNMALSAFNLEQSSKSTTIDAQRAQTQRTKQEIDEHVRAGDPTPIITKAKELGIPLNPYDRYAGLNPVEAANRRNEDYKAAQEYINKNVGPVLSTVDNDIADLVRAKQLNNEIATGKYAYAIPGVSGVAKALSGDRAKIQDFDSIAQRALKAQRIPGDHNISNFDVQTMAKGTFSSDKEHSTNDQIISYLLAQKQRDKDYNSYLSDYAAVNGSLGPHAQSAWRQYLDANPIMTRDANGRVVLNPNRISYQQYFTMPRVKVGADGKEIPQ